MAQLSSLTPFQRHKRLLRELESFYNGRQGQPEEPAVRIERTDADVLDDTYRFIRTDEDDQSGDPWEIKLARTYYSKLFREYAIIDLSRYKTGEFGCRWRTKQEVVSGKGQFTCGATTCDEREGLESFEVPFEYVEAGVQKQALVKVRLCQKHAGRLNYKKNKRILKAQQKAKRKRGERSKSPERKRRKEGTSPERRRRKEGKSPDRRRREEEADAVNRSAARSPTGEARATAAVQAGSGEPAKTASEAARVRGEVDDFLSQLLL